jgi:hypothetical protein
MKICQYLLEKDIREKLLANPVSKALCEQLAANLESVYNFSDKVNRDLLFHVSSMVYLINSELQGKDYRLKYFDIDSLGIENECGKLAITAKIGAYMHYEKTLELNEKLIVFRGEKHTLFQLLQEACNTNQLNLKQTAFRVLRDAFDKIGKNEQLRSQYAKDETLAKELFELVMQNWEFPIRGFANSMEEVFFNYLTLFPSEAEKVALMKRIVKEFPSNTRRKFASLRLILRGVDIDEYLKNAPSILTELLCFEKVGGATYVVQLFKEILNQAYLKLTAKYPKDKARVITEWTGFWIEEYVKVITTATQEHVEDLNEYVNPQIFTVCEKSLPLVIKRLFSTEIKSSATFQSVQASLLRYARSKDIFVCEKNQWNLKGADTDFKMDWSKFISEIICHQNRHIALDAMRIVLEPKKDSLNPHPIEYELLERALIYDTKNSYPDFRNDMSVAIKKFLHRLRNNLNPHFKKVTSQETFESQVTSEATFKQFVDFMVNFKTTVLRENYPDAPYESIYPLLENAKIIYESFNDQPFYFRKKTRFEG